MIQTTLKQFETTLKKLVIAKNRGLRICQNHFGDFLMIETEKENVKYRVWLSHEANVSEGQSKWQIEAYGKFNSYVWQIVGEGNK